VINIAGEFSYANGIGVSPNADRLTGIFYRRSGLKQAGGQFARKTERARRAGEDGINPHFSPPRAKTNAKFAISVKPDIENPLRIK
jgi:hypothetical protein